jgi:polygalacturonase
MTGKLIFGIALIIACASSPAAVNSTYDVRNYGAKGDGLTKDTDAIQRALDACATNGGGTVVVPEGVYLTGAIVVGSKTTLELERKSNLMGSPDIADYPLRQVRWEGEFREGHRALISADQADHVTIRGPGSVFGPPIRISKLRNPRGPVLIELTECTNTVLENFTTEYEQLWSIHLLFCEKLTVNGLTIRTINDNGDGIDVDSCRDVVIEHTSIDTGDDAISLKSGRGLAAQQLGRPTEDITIRDCTLTSSIFAAIGFGTEMSGGIRNVRVENCILSGHQNAIYVKSRDGRGGYMENITGENLIINNSPTFIGIDLLKKGIQATDPVPGEVAKWPLVKDLAFNHVQLNHVAEIVAGKNVPTQRLLDGLTLTDVTGTCGRGISLANMVNVKLSGINVTGFAGPLIAWDNVKGTGLNKIQRTRGQSSGKTGHRADTKV